MKKVAQAALALLFLALMIIALWRWPITSRGSVAWMASMFAINIIRAPFA